MQNKKSKTIDYSKRARKYDKTYHGVFRLNTNLSPNNEVIIDVVLNDPANAYSAYSPANDARVSPELLSYLEDEFDGSHNNDYIISVKNERLRSDKMAQFLFVKTLHNKFIGKRIELYRERAKTLILGISFFILLVGLSLVNWFIPVTNLFLQMISDSVVIIQWVFGWAAVESLCFELPKINKKYKRALKLSLSKIEFC